MSSQITQPVFVQKQDLAKETTSFDICSSIENACGYHSVIGAQLIFNVWYIYPRTPEKRKCLVNLNVSINGSNITLSDEIIKTTKLTIDNIPMCFDNDILIDVLKERNVKPRSRIIFEKIKTPDGHMTDWLSGRRFLWIEIPRNHLPRTIKFGDFNMTLYYKEKSPTDRTQQTEVLSASKSERSESSPMATTSSKTKPSEKKGNDETQKKQVFSPISTGCSKIHKTSWIEPDKEVKDLRHKMTDDEDETDETDESDQDTESSASHDKETKQSDPIATRSPVDALVQELMDGIRDAFHEPFRDPLNGTRREN